jgi:hypothetical protein
VSKLLLAQSYDKKNQYSQMKYSWPGIKKINQSSFCPCLYLAGMSEHHTKKWIINKQFEAQLQNVSAEHFSWKVCVH